MDILNKMLEDVERDIAQLQTVRDALIGAMGEKQTSVPRKSAPEQSTVRKVVRRRARRKKNAENAVGLVEVPKTEDVIISPELQELFEQANKGN